MAGRQSLKFKQLRLKKASDEARKRKGECLSKSYVDCDAPMKWRCIHHKKVWSASYYSVISRGTWCSDCRTETVREKNTKYTIDDLHKHAEALNGKCLSEAYVGIQIHYEWKCECGHSWKATWANVSRGRWCGKCRRPPKLSIKNARDVARERGGRCLSKKYIDSQSILIWECEKGHNWKASLANVRHRTSWCPQCAGRMISMDEVNDLLRSRNGKLLSPSVASATEKLNWQCSNGHCFTMTWNKVKGGQWCSQCSSSYGEEVCRLFFEEIFKTPFQRARPSWLKNSRGNVMELDGYCEELELAFEHHGQQHYRHGTQHSTTRAQFIQRRRDDERKLRLCAKRGVKVVVVPEIGTLLPIREVPKFIYNKLNKEFGYKKVTLRSLKEIDCGVAYNRKEYEKLQELALQRCGKLLSNSYRGSSAHHEWECAEGHQWPATPSHVKNGTWCPICNRGVPRTIESLRTIADEYGGECLSKSYKTSASKYKFRCDEGHVFYAFVSNLEKGHWCRQCGWARVSQKRLETTKKELEELLWGKMWRLLSKDYEGIKGEITVRCPGNHKIVTTARKLKRNWFCSMCQRSYK